MVIRAVRHQSMTQHLQLARTRNQAIVGRVGFGEVRVQIGRAQPFGITVDGSPRAGIKPHRRRMEQPHGPAVGLGLQQSFDFQEVKLATHKTAFQKGYGFVVRLQARSYFCTARKLGGCKNERGPAHSATALRGARNECTSTALKRVASGRSVQALRFSRDRR